MHRKNISDTLQGKRTARSNKPRTRLAQCFLWLCLATGWQARAGEVQAAEVVVYGGTPAGVMAATAAARAGQTVIVVEPGRHLGGVVSGGLVETDIGDRDTVGGLAAEFFKRVATHYRSTYGETSKQYLQCREGLMFEPHVAERIFEQMLAECADVTILRNHRLLTVQRDARGIVQIEVQAKGEQAPRRVAGKIFIDASYEGDLLAAAGVPFRVGREGREEDGELLAGIAAGPDKGKADHRLMTFNYRVSLTERTENRVLIPKPTNYAPSSWINFGDRIEREGLTRFSQLLIGGERRAGPNDKYDINWGDLPEANQGYVEGDLATREKIAARYRDHFLSLLYYLQNDPGLPAAWRANAHTWGLSKDEFVDNWNFPFQLYVRQARRMVGQYVLTEQDITQNRYKWDGVGMGSYGIDCHTIRYVQDGGRQRADTTPHYAVPSYDIPYRSLVPADRPGQPQNLLVPVCISATHVAYCSLRMEPVYMMLGHAAGIAAHLAISGQVPVQRIQASALRLRLRREGAVLDTNFQPQFEIKWSPARPAPGTTVDIRAYVTELRDPIRRIWWDFEGDGAMVEGDEQTDYAFKLAKTYQVSLMVEDTVGRRRLISAQVPVGTAEETEVTLDDSEAEFTGKWEGSYPKLVGKGRSPDVFHGAGVRYAKTTDETSPPTAKFTPSLQRPGHYRVSIAFRPAPDQPAQAEVTIRHAGKTSKVEVNQRQQKEKPPMLFVPVGDFYFGADGKESVMLSCNRTNERLAVDAIRFTWLGR